MGSEAVKRRQSSLPRQRVRTARKAGSRRKKERLRQGNEANSIFSDSCYISSDWLLRYSHIPPAFPRSPNKDNPSFQNLEAALPPAIRAGRRSSSRPSVLLMPESATIGSIPAANGRSAWRDREVWMPSEPGWPRIILVVYPRPPGEEGAKDRDSFMRTGRTCMSTPRLFPPCPSPAHLTGLTPTGARGPSSMSAQPGGATGSPRPGG